MREPRNIQRFLSKIFEGIDNLSFQANGEVTAIHSKEGETVKLVQTVMANESVECWLKKLEAAMKKTIKAVTFETYKDNAHRQYHDWIKNWPGQVVLTVTSVIFTKEMTEIMNGSDRSKIGRIHKEIVDEIDVLTSMIRSKISDVHRTTMSALITSRVHDRDQVAKMISELRDSKTKHCFIWQMYMKFHYELEDAQPQVPVQPPASPKLVDEGEGTSEPKQPKSDHEPSQDADADRDGDDDQERNDDDDADDVEDGEAVQAADGGDDAKDEAPSVKTPRVVEAKHEVSLKHIKISILNAERNYGYEYLGNTTRLVITPLTDRCHCSLFMALHYGYGGAPEGPVGTGKTETTKDLAKCLAKHCFVFNCSSTLNYSAMTKFFKGLATSGAWSCFDEFNRISLIVLSVISQIIIVIQGAIRENISEFLLEETKINFDRECAIFITMNPTYSGRTELPDNLKSLFRTVAIIVPDSLLISEILLYSYGFFEAKSLAQKLIYTFHLAKQQLSQQVHYDFGLRAIKIVLSSAGILKLITSGIVELGTKLTDDFKPQNESADKAQGQADGKDEGEDVLDQPDAKQSKRKSRQFKLKSKMSTKNFKVFKEGRSLKRKETKRHAKEADDAAPKPDNREEQKGIHEQESSLSSKDILNKDNLSVSSLDSEDIIYNDQDLNEDQLNFKETVTQAYKGKGKLIPVKETEASFATKLNYISDK